MSLATGELAQLLLRAQIADLLALEYELLDERRFEEWLDLLTDDVQYVMPLARNVARVMAEREYTRPGQDTVWFDEGKPELALRVEQLLSADHWAEEPASRTTHMVANIRVAEHDESSAAVNSRFLVYRTRLDSVVELVAGKRADVLRLEKGAWKIARRQVLIDQSTLTWGNLSTFF